MEGQLIIGHGSLRHGSAASMERVAACLSDRLPEQLVICGFLNFGSPSMQECAAQLVADGAERVTVHPYFLTDGQYAQRDLPLRMAELRHAHPGVRWSLAPVLGRREGVAGLLHARIQAWRDGLPETQGSGVVLAAHGSRYPRSVSQVLEIADTLRLMSGDLPLTAGFLELNRPELSGACHGLLDQGVCRLAVAPYFLHAGRHVREDLARIVETLASERPEARVDLLEPLDDTESLAALLAVQPPPESQFQTLN